MTTKERNTITIGELREILEDVEQQQSTLSREEFNRIAALFDYEMVKAGKDPSYYKRLKAAVRIYALGKIAGMKEVVFTSKKKNPHHSTNESKCIDPKEILDILKKQELDLSEPSFGNMCNLFETIEKHCRETPSLKSNATRWACWYAMQYGKIEGIREERQRHN